jgi:hypothetical protein
MSLVFMTITMMVYATHTNWKDAVTNPQNGLQARLKKAKDEVATLESQREKTLNELALERAARAESLAVLEVRSRELSQQLVKAEDERQRLRQENAEKIKLLETNQNQMKRLKDEVDAMRGEIRTARLDRDGQLTEARSLADKLNQSEGELRRLKERNNQLIGELSSAKLILDRNGTTVDTPVDDIPPKVDGIVTAVRNSNLIEVSMGTDEGIRRGHTLDVYRATGAYLGRLQVIETSSDRAVGRIVPEFLQGVIRKGDRVASRLL